MNLLETIYCSQYYELKKTGKDPQKGRLNANLLSAVVIMLWLGTAFFILNHFFPHNPVSDFFKRSSRKFIGPRTMGKVFGLLFLALVVGVLFFTIGSKDNYKKIMAKWELLPEEVLEPTVKKALLIFFISFAVFIIALVWDVYS